MIGNIVAGTLSVGVPPVTTSYESIATVTVGSGGASSIDFTSIPSTYKHLQIRLMAKFNNGVNYSTLNLRVGNGSIDTTNSYSWHNLYGTGSGSGGAENGSTTSYMNFYSGNSSNQFGVAIIDILDYANTSKYKTARNLYGTDTNGAGIVGLASGLWQKTNAIDTISLLYYAGGSFSQYTHAALYGIKD